MELKYENKVAKNITRGLDAGKYYGLLAYMAKMVVKCTNTKHLFIHLQYVHSHHFMADRWGNNGNSERLYFGGFQNQCRW